MVRLVGFSIALLALASVPACSAGNEAPPVDTAEPFAGYTLYAPNFSRTTYLIDMAGQVVHTWESEYEPGQSAYLLENGHLLRTACVGPANRTFRGGGAGGRVQEFTWEGEIVWDFELSTDRRLLHHDIERLPNGNVLMIAWELKTAEEALAAGRDPELVKGRDLWSDCIIEVKPTGPTSGEIVWEWRVWDHLVQDRDPSRANFGKLEEHPGRIDLNHVRWAVQTSRRDWDRLEGLGYVSASRSRRLNPDWIHTNSIDHHPDLDQIVLSVLGFNEIWIVDHGTTTAEAAGRSGGKRGRGGELLYRWGNPAAWGMGTEDDRQLFFQHDATWIPEGRPGAGHILLFNNGRGRPGGDHSSVDEVPTPLTPVGLYHRDAGKPFGPAGPIWRYVAPEKETFYSEHISGAERLPNGNTLVCSGARGEIFEVSPSGTIVWTHTYEPPPDDDPAQSPRRGPGGRAAPARSVFRAYRYAIDHPALGNLTNRETE